MGTAGAQTTDPSTTAPAAKSDGTRVTVKLDSNFTVTATETDEGRGGG
jgi:hypothetical protein